MKAAPTVASAAFSSRPPGPHPARKILVLTELLIEYFGESPHLAVLPLSQHDEAPAYS